MAGPTTQVLSDDLKTLRKEVSDFRLESSRFMAQVSSQLAFLKWIGVFFSGILVALVCGAVTVAWNASAVNSEIKQQGMRIERMSRNSDDLIQRLDRIDRRLEALGERSKDNESKRQTGAGE